VDRTLKIIFLPLHIHEQLRVIIFLIRFMSNVFLLSVLAFQDNLTNVCCACFSVLVKPKLLESLRRTQTLITEVSCCW